MMNSLERQIACWVIGQGNCGEAALRGRFSLPRNKQHAQLTVWRRLSRIKDAVFIGFVAR